MGQDPITAIISILFKMYAFIVIVRLLLQLAGADYYNPISQAVVKLTKIPLTPLQKLLPRVGRIDISPLVLAWAILFVMMLVLFGHTNILILAGMAGIGVIDSILQIYYWTVIGAVIISWIAPDSYHPAPQLILQLTEPLFRLSRKVIPPIGGLDLSPILIFIVIGFVLQPLLSQLTRQLLMP